ncbi:flhB C-terminus-related protein [Evansella caseinilytica]|uniref:FlhB C-terminus-related protein n=1 Tax=Evansella caseinilytica TaxID=1503961 RepID=A0A1H3M9C2_9BACI|nr:flhB C-terminus-related protein [Evansella caseinilytica]
MKKIADDRSEYSVEKKRAVALGYDAALDTAPIVKAKGKGYVAEEIIKRAKAENIPIQEDESLLELLSQLEINEKIPPALYHVVAEVFAFVYQLDQAEKGKTPMDVIGDSVHAKGKGGRGNDEKITSTGGKPGRQHFAASTGSGS